MSGVVVVVRSPTSLYARGGQPATLEPHAALCLVSFSFTFISKVVVVVVVVVKCARSLLLSFKSSVQLQLTPC